MNILKVILSSVAIIIFDLAVYVVLGLLMMNYDDFYDESEGEYWSLSSMTKACQLAIEAHGGDTTASECLTFEYFLKH